METVPVTLLIIPDTVENVSIVCIPYNTLLQARKQEQRKHSVDYGLWLYSSVFIERGFFFKSINATTCR